MIYPEQSSVGMIQLSILISLITTLTFIIISSSIFGGPLNSIFAANFAPLSTRDRIISIGFWCCVFGCKLLGSYFFLSLSFKDSLETIYKIRSDDRFDENPLIPYLTIITMILTELMFFLWDTHFWFIVWKKIFSTVRTLMLRSSWKNDISMLQENISKKILVSGNLKGVSLVWNGIVNSMYEGHLLSKEELGILTEQQVRIFINKK